MNEKKLVKEITQVNKKISQYKKLLNNRFLDSTNKESINKSILDLMSYKMNLLEDFNSGRESIRELKADITSNFVFGYV